MKTSTSLRTTGVCSLDDEEKYYTIDKIVVRTSNHGRLAPLDYTRVPAPDWYDVFIHDGVVE